MTDKVSSVMYTDAADQIRALVERLTDRRVPQDTYMVRYSSSMDVTMALEHLRDAELRFRAVGMTSSESTSA
jgi:hypothetical protein